MNYAQARRLRTTTNALRSAVEARPCSRYFDDDAAASLLGRRWLRAMNDNDLAWLAHLSPVNLAHVCGYVETTPAILMLARSYERARRLAFPQHEIGAASGAPLHASRDSDLSAPQGDRARLAAHSAEDAA